MNVKKSWFLCVIICASTAIGWEGQPDRWHSPVFFEQENGLFQVAIQNRQDQEIIAYQGVYVEKCELPMPSIVCCPATVYAISGKYQEVKKSEAPFKPVVEDMFTENPPLWPVVEQIPHLTALRLSENRVSIGVRLIYDFYAMTELGMDDLPAGTEILEDFRGRVHPVVKTDECNTIIKAWQCQVKGGKAIDARD